MGVEHGANDGQAHPGAAAVAPRGEEAVEDLGPVVGRDAFAVVADGHLQPIALPRRGQIERRTAVAHGIVGKIGKDDQGVVLGDPHRRVEVAAGADIERGKGRAQARDRDRQSCRAERDRIFRAGEIAQAARDRSQPVGVGDDVVEKLAPVLIVHVGRVDVLAQQFGRALDRRQRRFEFMRDMGGEGRDEAGARVQPPRHVEETLRQQGEFAGAVMPQRAQRVAVALADQIGALHQFAHRSGDGAVKQKADQQRRHDHRKHREDHPAALLVEVFEDVARRARGIDDAGDLVAHDHRHRDEDAHPGAPAHRIERGLLVLGDAHAQHALEAALQRFAHFLQMRQRQARLRRGRRSRRRSGRAAGIRPASPSGWRPDPASCARRGRRRRDRPARRVGALPAAAAARSR